MHCRSTIEKYKARFAEKPQKVIDKEMESEIENLKDLSYEEQQKLKFSWIELCGKSDVRFNINSSNAVETYHQYRKNMISIEYKIEEHCDRFINHVHKTLESFEKDIEADSI